MSTLRQLNMMKAKTDNDTAIKFCVCRRSKDTNMLKCQLCKDLFHSRHSIVSSLSSLIISLLGKPALQILPIAITMVSVCVLPFA